jgi:hypothetical protein
MRRPNLFIVGGSKSGTSNLQEILNYHSDFYLLPYESHFFSRHFFNRDIDAWSEEVFSGHFDKKYIGDKSVTHVNSKTYLQAIKRYCGDDVKIIFMMRDPIDKFLSWWTFMRSVVQSKIDKDYSVYSEYYYDSIFSEIDETWDFQRFLEFQLERYEFLDEHQPYRMSSMNKIQLGRYDILINNIQEVFGDNCFYIITEDFKKNRSKVLRELFKYLEVEHEELPYFVSNTSDKKWLSEVNDDDIKLLTDIYRPSVEKVKEVVGDKIQMWRDYGIEP